MGHINGVDEKHNYQVIVQLTPVDRSSVGGWHDAITFHRKLLDTFVDKENYSIQLIYNTMKVWFKYEEDALRFKLML